MAGMTFIVVTEIFVFWLYHRPFDEMSLLTGLPLLLNILILLINFSCQLGFLRLAGYFKNPFVEAGTCTQLAFANSMLLNKNSLDANRIWFWIIELSSLYFVFIIFKNALTLKKKLNEITFENPILGGST